MLTKTKLEWVKKAADYYSDSTGRFDLFYVHQERAWVAYDHSQDATGKSQYGDLTAVKDWCQDRM